MSIGGIGSTPSFYQQDQSYWSNAHAEDAAQSADSSLIDVMGAAQVNKAKGLAAIANGTALKRVNSELVAAVQSALGETPTGSTSSSSNSSTSASSSSTGASASTKVQPASGTGTVPVTRTTTLSSLGILPGGTLTFGDGGNSPTVYTSTGTDTVGDVINAINNGPAFLTASINSGGKLTVTARDTTASVVISGSGTDATAVGFGNNNNTFQPVQPTASTLATSTSSSTASSSTSSTSSSTSSSSSSKSAAVPSAFEESAGSAASILSASGVSGTLVNMLA
jgi:hypothetical protein